MSCINAAQLSPQNSNIESDAIVDNNKDDARVEPTVALGCSADSSPETRKRKLLSGADSESAAKISARHQNRSSVGVEKVFVWDLDETLIVFQTLLSGVYARKTGKDTKLCESLALRMESLIFDFCEKHFFFEDLEDRDQAHADDADEADDGIDLEGYDFRGDGFRTYRVDSGSTDCRNSVDGGDFAKKLAYRYRRMKTIYESARHSMAKTFDEIQTKDWRSLRENIESLTENWSSVDASNCLKTIRLRGNNVNIVVTNTQLVPALAKILLYELGPFFPVENVYSSAQIGKAACFRRLAERFGADAAYVVVGDGKEEEEVAEKMDFQFWKVSAKRDLASLYGALKLNYL